MVEARASKMSLHIVHPLLGFSIFFVLNVQQLILPGLYIISHHTNTNTQHIRFLNINLD